MPPRNDELPEGTDHIINGAMETGTGEAAAGGGASSGFIGASGGDGTGGTAAGGGNDMIETESSGAEGDRGGNGIAGQLRGQVTNLRDQAGGKVRGFAEDGKTRASDVLEELARVVADTADSIDERLGNNYGEYARKASDSVSNLAGSLRTKDVDELYGNVRDAVRKSPGVAIGIAAVVGFTLVRLVKAGLEEGDGPNRGGGRRSNSGGTGA
jgi:ElaB/YqjD/DUF883 family membrane-anchored ribosome-binding protein